MARNRAAEVAQEYKSGGGGKAQHFYPVNLDVADRLGLGMYKTVVGDNFLRILPPPDSEKLYCRKIYSHEKIGTEQVNILCPNRTHDAENKPMGKPCPICEFASELYRADNKSEAAKALFAKDRWLYFVVNTTNEKTQAMGPCWYSASTMLHDSVRDLSTNPRDTTKAVDISDPKIGQDLSFKRVGIQFSAFQLLQFQPIPEEWYKNLPAFDELLYFMEDEEVLRHLGTHGDVQETSSAPANSEPPAAATTEKVALTMPIRTRVEVPTTVPARTARAAVVETVQEDAPAETAAPAAETMAPVVKKSAKTVAPAAEKPALSNQVQLKLAEFQKRRAQATSGKEA